ncbi:hypothetical protein D3C80_2006900 [compost metagenome]
MLIYTLSEIGDAQGHTNHPPVVIMLVGSLCTGILVRGASQFRHPLPSHRDSVLTIRDKRINATARIENASYLLST